MKCIDEDQLIEIYGNWNSWEGRSLAVEIYKCSNDTYGGNCAPSDEIDAYLESKFLIIQQNNVLFDAAKPGKKAIIRQSKLVWHSYTRAFP